MYNDLRIAIVIPCYRVERDVRSVLESVPAFVDNIIAVNDASPDSTLEVLEGVSDPRLTVISHDRNQGVGGAMVTGFVKQLNLKAK